MFGLRERRSVKLVILVVQTPNIEKFYASPIEYLKLTIPKRPIKSRNLGAFLCLNINQKNGLERLR